MNNYKDIKYTHWCGCVTEKYKDGVLFLKVCKRHKDDEGRMAYIVIQHPKEEKKKK